MENKLETFSQSIKFELLRNEFKKDDSSEFISGLVSTGINVEGVWRLMFNNKEIIDQVMKLLFKNKVKHALIGKSILEVNWDILRVEEKPGIFYAGVFVGGGSISRPESKYYHLELRYGDKKQIVKAQNNLNIAGLQFTILRRKDAYIIYLKKSSDISEFIGLIGATNALFKMLELMAKRNIKGVANHSTNFEIHNIQKLVEANNMFLEQLEIIKSKNLFNKFRDIELEFFEIKKKNPNSSLNELTEIFEKKTGVHKTKAGLNHYLIKLRSVAENY